jgi:hypothetical protein
MEVSQRTWSPDAGWEGAAPDAEATLLLLFGGRLALNDQGTLDSLRADYPKAHIVGCSTAGEIAGTRVHDDTLVATAVRFASARSDLACIQLREGESSIEAGRRLVDKLPRDGLRHVLVLSDGLHVNGSDLVVGMTAGLPDGVQLTGGLAGDGAAFGSTTVVCGDRAGENLVAAIGFYGDAIQIGYGSLGGWDSFGPRRRVTRSEGNVLYELDGRPALSLYKEYLGDQAEGLPATGLLFPLSVQLEGRDDEVVRTILGIDEEAQSLTFAGDVPEGSLARLMKANFDRLVDGAHGAAKSTQKQLGAAAPELGILISCVGRKLVLKQRVEDELEAVREVLGPAAALTGFYSYGEICPAAPEAGCELHNQTMTITTLREA